MKKQDWLDGLKVIYPVIISYVPLGLAGGMVLYDAGFNAPTILLMSLLVFGGAAQFMAASMVSMGASISAIITMTFFLNLRHLLMSSSMSGFIKKPSLPFTLIFSHTLADESFAINYNQFKNQEWTANKALATNISAYLTWSLSTVVGGMLGSAWEIDTTIINYVLIAMFISLLVSQFVSKLYIFVGLTAGVLAVLFMILLQHTIALVIAAILASFIGYFADGYLMNRKMNTRDEGIKDD